MDIERRVFWRNAAMSKQEASNRITIPPEIEAEMTPVVKAFVVAAFARQEARIKEQEARIKELEGKLQKLTPQNSSVPPSTQHPVLQVRCVEQRVAHREQRRPTTGESAVAFAPIDDEA